MNGEIVSLVQETANSAVYGVWFLMGAALVFFMQCGFAMVEAGFTRAKNAGNIIMKNLMDFCIGTVVFILLGFSLMLAEDYFMGIIGIPNLDIFTNYANFDWSGFVFNLVFCATAATIVSGAMAERTKFLSYCIYSGAISLVVYPIEAGWVWNSQGWLAQLGFIDFAGSAAIHTVGGTAALIGAAILGPRIGKYVKDAKTGKITAKAIPGHSLTLGALGCFILWFGWYGFNGAAATRLDGVGGLASIFVTTTIAPAIASCVTMVFTWIRYGKPDVSMTLNASLAGLVGITAGCATLDALGAIVVGVVSGFLVVIVVEVMDNVLHIDDPVGAVAVHFANGIWGTLAVGLLAVDGGLFYGGGLRQLGIQLIGILAILAWTTVTMFIIFTVIKKTVGLRVTPEEELGGLDAYEHGLESAYADFVPAVPTVMTTTYKEGQPAAVTTQKDTVSVKTVPTKVKATDENGHPISKVVIVTKQSKFEALKDAMAEIGVTGMTVTQVIGCGVQAGKTTYYRGVAREMNLLPKIKVEIVVSAVPVEAVVDAAKKSLYTGNIGDGKIFVYDVENVIKVRTGEEGYDALQGEDQW
ncbi:MAG: ammonium transporter [Oscillospiraceae bacterium]|nr:ammonium transporter [Oscillospiraceae bacterium]